MPLIPYNRSQSQVLSVSRRLLVSTNGGALGPFSSDTGSYTLSKNFSGYKQPGWRTVIRRKGNATTSASGSIETLVIPYTSNVMKRRLSFNGNIERFVGDGYVSMFQYSELLPITSSAPVSQIDAIALTKFLKACKGAQRQFSGGVFLGELRETLHLIKNPASAFRSLITDYVGACRRTSRRLSPRDTVKHISNQWLEFSFGMLPLLSDISDGYKALERLYFNLPTKYVSAKESRDYEVNVLTKNSALWAQYFPVLVHCKSTGTYSRTWRGEVRLAMQGIGSPPSEALGFTIRDFIPTVYELIPYSFLVDYFTNIGDILEAASFNQADLIWNCSTSRSTVDKQLQVDPKAPSFISGGELLDWSVMPGKIVYKIQSFSRTTVPSGTLGIPSFGFKCPGNWSKFLNIGALAFLRSLR